MTAIHGRFMRAQMLLDRGALVDIGDKEGCTIFFLTIHHLNILACYELTHIFINSLITRHS
jgi:hypothetical protein